MGPKSKWWQKDEDIFEPEVVVYALIVLKHIGTRKRRREENNLAELSSLKGLLGTSPAWWEDIAEACKCHDETKHMAHLHNAGALLNWFTKKRDQAKSRGSTFRDAVCAARWKDHLQDTGKRAKLEAFFEIAQRNVKAGSSTPPAATESEPSVIDEVHEAINSGVEWNVQLQKEVDLLCGDGDGKTVFNQLYNTKDDTNFTNLDPQAIMGVVQKHCIMLFTVVSIISARPRDSANKTRTPKWKQQQGTFKLLEFARLRSQQAVPVFCLFMAMVFFASSTSRHVIDGKAASGANTSTRTLITFFKARAERLRSAEVLAARFPPSQFILCCYDNYVKASRKVKEQSISRVNKMVVGTMQLAGIMQLPVGLDFEATSGPCSLFSMFLADVLGVVSTEGSVAEASRNQQRALQLAMAKAGDRFKGVSFPARPNPPSPETLKMHTLEFSLENSGTIEGNRHILQGYQDMFQFDSGDPRLFRSVGFVVGDQLTFNQMERYKLNYALTYGRASWVYPIPGDFHFYWHVLECAFLIYWGGGLQYLAKILKRTGVKKVASQGVFEIQHGFFHAVYEGALAALLEMWVQSTGYIFPDREDDNDNASVFVQDFLKWVEECSQEDRVFAYWADFVLSFGQLYLDCRRAIHTGDADALLYVYRQMLVLFHMAGKFNYTRLVLEHLLDIGLYPEWASSLMRANRTIKLTNRKYANTAIDRVCEFKNGLTKKLHKETATPETMRYITANLDLVQQVRNKSREHHGTKHSNRHARVRLTADVQKVKEQFLMFKVFDPYAQRDPDKEATKVYSVFPVVDEAADAAKEPEGAPSAPDWERVDWERDALRVKDAESYHMPELETIFRSIVVVRTEADMSIRAAGVLNRARFTVSEDSDVGRRLPEAVGYEFSMMPKSALQVAKAEVEMLRWQAAQNKCQEGWRLVHIGEMLALREQQTRDILGGISKEAAVRAVEAEFNRLMSRTERLTVTIVVLEDNVAVSVTAVRPPSAEVDRMWKDAYWGELGIRRPADAPKSEHRWSSTHWWPKDYQLRESVSEFNMYAFKAVNNQVEVPDNIKAHNSELTKGWLRNQEVVHFMTGTRKEMQRVVTANKLPTKTRAQAEKKCCIPECQKTAGDKKYVLCSTPHSDGCGHRFCEACVLAGLPDPYLTPRVTLLAEKWKLSEGHYLCSESCKAEVSAPEVELTLTDEELEQIQANYQADLAALDDEEFQELYWDEHIARLEEEEAEEMYAENLEAEVGTWQPGGQPAEGYYSSDSDDDLPSFDFGILPKDK